MIEWLLTIMKRCDHNLFKVSVRTNVGSWFMCVKCKTLWFGSKADPPLHLTGRDLERLARYVRSHENYKTRRRPNTHRVACSPPRRLVQAAQPCQVLARSGVSQEAAALVRAGHPIPR